MIGTGIPVLLILMYRSNDENGRYRLLRTLTVSKEKDRGHKLVDILSLYCKKGAVVIDSFSIQTKTKQNEKENGKAPEDFPDERNDSITDPTPGA